MGGGEHDKKKNSGVSAFRTNDLALAAFYNKS